LLLQIVLDAVERVALVILVNNVNQLVHLLSQADHSQVTHSVEQVKVERSPLVNFDLTVRLGILGRIHALILFFLWCLFVLAFFI